MVAALDTLNSMCGTEHFQSHPVNFEICRKFLRFANSCVYFRKIISIQMMLPQLCGRFVVSPTK